MVFYAQPSSVQRAEAMYRRCLAVNPEHSYALYNLAVLKEETTKNGDYSEVRLTAALFLPVVFLLTTALRPF